MDRFHWDKAYKMEEWLEQQSFDAVVEYVLDFYGVEEIEQLTYDNIQQISAWEMDATEDFGLFIVGAGVRQLCSYWEFNVQAN